MRIRWWLLLFALALTACGFSQTEGPYRSPGVLIGDGGDGAVLYARNCAWCHGAGGSGTTKGPDLNGELDGGAYTHFMLSSGRMPLPTPQTKATRQPAAFTDDEIATLVAYVKTFGGTGPPVPTPSPALGSVPSGLDLYLTNCAACHSTTGIGGALTNGVDAPPLNNPDITPTQIASAMLVGPGCSNGDPTCGLGSGAMPHFDFNDQEVNDIVAYVGYLQLPRDEGGWSIGSIGPVAEGAAAWIVGLVAMLAVGRWIGTRIGEEL